MRRSDFGQGWLTETKPQSQNLTELTRYGIWEVNLIQLSAPRLITVAISLVLLGFVVASFYLRIPTIGHYISGHRIGVLLAGYGVLALGVVSKRL